MLGGFFLSSIGERPMQKPKAITLAISLGGDLHVMKARCRCLTSAGLGAPSCAKGGPNRDTLPEVRHQLLIERHYADTRRPFADIRRHGSAS
jgi:hypothetical protein